MSDAVAGHTEQSQEKKGDARELEESTEKQLADRNVSSILCEELSLLSTDP